METVSNSNDFVFSKELFISFRKEDPILYYDI